MAVNAREEIPAGGAVLYVRARGAYRIGKNGTVKTEKINTMRERPLGGRGEALSFENEKALIEKSERFQLVK